jgi:adenine-specific DNA-methyltransferase
MIYIDPPYNTGNDSFVYPDDYSERLDEYNKRTGVTDEEGYLNKQDLWRKNSRENGQFHSVWLSMMYPRLYLARNLLRDDGVIFVSIDDNEVSNLKLIMNEVFGEENFVSEFIWEKKYTTSNNIAGVSDVHEYIICYVKNALNLEKAISRLPYTEEAINRYKNPDNDPRGDWMDVSYHGPKSPTERPNLNYAIIHPKTGKEIYPTEKSWAYEKSSHLEHVKENRLWWGKDLTYSEPRLKKYISEIKGGIIPKSLLSYDEVGGTATGRDNLRQLFGEGEALFDNPKPISLLIKTLQIGAKEDSLILDFFAGSGTTAQAVLDLNEEDGGNRKFICVQMPEVLEENSEAYKAGYRTIADISKARITKVIEKLQKARAEQLALKSKPQVLGFRSFKIAPSNFKSWRGDVTNEELLRQLEIFQQSEKDGSLHENMLVELLLKSGLPLTSDVERLSFQNEESIIQDVYVVDGGKLLFFFGGYHAIIKELIHTREPQRVICLDSAFKGKDEDISNFKLELKEAGIELSII